VVEEITPDQAPDAVNPPDEAVSDYCLDLRRTWAKDSDPLRSHLVVVPVQAHYSAK